MKSQRTVHLSEIGGVIYYPSLRCHMRMTSLNIALNAIRGETMHGKANG